MCRLKQFLCITILGLSVSVYALGLQDKANPSQDNLPKMSENATLLAKRVSVTGSANTYSTATLPFSTSQINQFYVSPAGTAEGDGSKERPWDLATALAQPSSVNPGATIWLRGGTYYGAFTSALTGTETAPITVRAYPGERSILDGSGHDYQENPLTVNGAWTIYWGLEVMNSSRDRATRRAGAINVFGPHTKFINNILHDANEGISVWTAAIDAEVYGNLIFNGGWQGALPDRGHGHGIYTQNDTGTKIYRDNIIFNQYGYGFHAYTENGGIKGFLLEGNVAFNNGQPVREHTREPNILIGGLQPAGRITLLNNYTFHPADTDAVNVQLHYAARNNQDLEMRGNYFVNGNMTVFIRGWWKTRFVNNTIIGKLGLLTLYLPIGLATSAYRWDENLYYQNNMPTTPFNFNGTYISFANWQEGLGFDKHGQFTQGPPSNQVFIRPNQYEPGRANIIVYNLEEQDKVTVDLGKVLKMGARYEIRNAQDYFAAPVQSGIYDGKLVQLPMKNLTVAQPIGARGVQATGLTFNVFVLLPLS